MRWSVALDAYQGVIQSSSDERLTNRARLGLARIYEMENHLDKVRAQYREVTGAYAEYAKREAERLDKPDSQDTYTWLATAQPPRQQVPMGPGVPGQTPPFSPADLGLPGDGCTRCTWSKRTGNRKYRLAERNRGCIRCSF